MEPISYVDQGVDYLTCTFNPRANITRLQFYLNRTIASETALGGIRRKWGMSGYLGERVGGLEFGHRHDGVCVRLIGPTAQLWWYKFAKLSTNCSRIDLQQTVVMDEHFSRTVRRHYREMRKYWSMRKQFPEPKMIVGPHGPESVYSGDRSSETYLRLYHRGSKPKCEAFMGHVRFECELKGDRARLTLSELMNERRNPNWMTGAVAGYFENRGACLQWSDHCRPPIGCPRPPSDVEKSLRWLATSVRPTVRRLIELGRREDVLIALGLSEDGPSGPNTLKGE